MLALRVRCAWHVFFLANLLLHAALISSATGQELASAELIPLPPVNEIDKTQTDEIVFEQIGDLDYHYQLDLDPVPNSPVASTSFLAGIRSDYRNFYDRQSLTALATGVGVHAVLANTNIDDWVRHEYQERLRGARTDEWAEIFHSPKIFGEGSYLLPVYAVTALAARRFDMDPPIGVTGEWGERSLRTVLVGAPPMLGLQLLIGASRPDEQHSNSHWEPFQDDNGVSGHAFMGAIPFLSAAKMTEKPAWKAFWYFGSAMPALSRVNDDDHYTSQVLLGWSLAYLASSAVDDSFRSCYAPEVAPGPVGSGTGLNFLWKF